MRGQITLRLTSGKSLDQVRWVLLVYGCSRGAIKNAVKDAVKGGTWCDPNDQEPMLLLLSNVAFTDCTRQL